MGIPHSSFEEELEKLKAAKGVKQDTDLTATDLQELVEEYKNVYVKATGGKFPSGIKYGHQLIIFSGAREYSF